jgi:hypothetical protein
MFDYVTLLPLVVLLVFLASGAFRPLSCPDCGAPLAALMSPSRKTRRTWRAGGRTCTQCGCETDQAGRKIAADAPMPPFPARQGAAAGLLLIIGLGLVTSLLYATPRPAPPAVAAPVAPAR